MVKEYARQREEQLQFTGNLVRLQTTALLNIHLKEKIKPHQLWEYPWDDHETNRDKILKELSPEEFEANYRRFLGLSTNEEQ